MDQLVAVADGVRLRVLRWPGGATAFLLVHGLASNASLWGEVADSLAAQGHPVYAVDLRGHGESDRPELGYDTATAAADLAAVADTLGLTRLAVAGQSWGGNVVVRLAADRPDLVVALALIDGGWIHLAAEFGSWQRCEAALRPPELDGQRADDLLRFIRANHPGWSQRAVQATVANLRVRPDGRLERRLPIPQHMRIVRSMWDDPPQPWFPRITAPTLLVPAIPAGDPERARRKSAAVQAAAAALAGPTTIREYVGGDHDLHAQQPGALAADLIALAARVDSPAAP
jgi:pimeloyl-ACP methyl ester carboxylesterase